VNGVSSHLQRCRQVTLLLVNRFSGGAVSALSHIAGVAHESTSLDASLGRFERQAAAAGLRLRRGPVPEAVAGRVRAEQSLATRAQWWLAAYWDGLLLYQVSLECGSIDT